MKTILQWLLLLGAVCLQLIIGQTWGNSLFAAPIALIMIIVFASFVSTEQLLYMSLVAGVLLDLASGRDFGLTITFMLFVALFCKLVMRLGTREQSLLTTVLLSALMTVLLSFMQFVLVFSPGDIGDISRYLSHLAVLVAYAVVWAMVLYWMISSLDRAQLVLPKMRLWVGRRR